MTRPSFESGGGDKRQDYCYVTQDDWDRACAALRAVLPLVESMVSPLSTEGTMITLRDQIRDALYRRTTLSSVQPP